MTQRDKIRRLTKRRKVLGATLDNVAEGLKVHRSTIHCWETGKRSVHEVFLKAWEVLILRWETDGPPPKVPEKPSPSPPTTIQPTIPPDNESSNGEAAKEAESQAPACASPLKGNE